MYDSELKQNRVDSRSDSKIFIKSNINYANNLGHIANITSNLNKMKEKPESSTNNPHQYLLTNEEITRESRVGTTNNQKKNKKNKDVSQEIIDRENSQNLRIVEESKIKLRQRLRKNNLKKNIRPKNSKVDDLADENKATDEVIGVESINRIKSSDDIHDPKQNDETNTHSKTDEIKLPRFKKLADNSKVHLEKKYRTNIPSLSQKHKNTVNDEDEANLEDAKKRKLRKAQFELKKLKEEIAQKNIEVLAITKDLQKYERGNTAVGNLKRKTTISPFRKENEVDHKTSKNTNTIPNAFKCGNNISSKVHLAKNLNGKNSKS